MNHCSHFPATMNTQLYYKVHNNLKWTVFLFIQFLARCFRNHCSHFQATVNTQLDCKFHNNLKWAGIFSLFCFIFYQDFLWITVHIFQQQWIPNYITKFIIIWNELVFFFFNFFSKIFRESVHFKLLWTL